MTPERLRTLLARAGDDHGTSDDIDDLLLREEFAGHPPVPAAVLVPILAGPAPSVLLTRRTAHLKKHAGQVSFPGGRIDPEDSSPEAAALREAEEEIGLSAADAELIGRLPDHMTGTNYLITPVVALLSGDLDLARLTLSPDEVDSIFTFPLSEVIDPDLPRRMTAHWRGRERQYWEWPHPEYHIWGATARILMVLGARLRGEL